MHDHDANNFSIGTMITTIKTRVDIIDGEPKYDVKIDMDAEAMIEGINESMMSTVFLKSIGGVLSSMKDDDPDKVRDFLINCVSQFFGHEMDENDLAEDE